MYMPYVTAMYIRMCDISPILYSVKTYVTLLNRLFIDLGLLISLIFDCNISRAYAYIVKLYYLVRIEMQVGVRTLNLLKYSTDLQQTKYTLGYVENNLVNVLPTDLYPQFICLNAKFFAQACSQYAL